MGIRKTINKDKSDFSMATCQSQEASATIPVGTPVIFKIDGTALDGLGVILPSSSTAIKATAFFGGVMLRSLTAGDRGEMLTSGFAQTALYCRGTRASTTDNWPSFAAIALGDHLMLDTVANAFAMSTVGAARSSPPLAVVADTSQTAASTTTATSSAYTQWSTNSNATVLMKMIIRNM